MQEKAAPNSLSIATILTLIGFMVFQYMSFDNNPHLRKAYSGKMELYHAAQMAIKYERLYKKFLNGRRWPGSHFGMLKDCPSNVTDDALELANSKTRIVTSLLSGTGLEIGEPLLDWSVTKYKVTVKHKIFVPAAMQSSFASSDSTTNGVVSTEYVLSTMRPMSVDFLVANSILQHTEHTIAFLTQMLRVIRHQGHLLLVVPNNCFGLNRHRIVTDWQHFEEERSSRRAISNHEEHLHEWALSHLNGKLPDNSTARIDQIVAQFRPPTGSVSSVVTSARPALTSYDYHTWDCDSLTDFLSQAHAVLEQPYSVREIVAHGREILAVLQRL